MYPAPATSAPSFALPPAPCSRRLDVPCSSNLSTFDLETEIFLHLLQNCVDYVRTDPSPLRAGQGQGAAVAQQQRQPGVAPARAKARGGQ